VRLFGKSFPRESQQIRFTGDFASWEDAEKVSTGYSAPQILKKTRAALLKVKAGEAAFERDSVTFNVMRYEFSLLAGLLRAANASAGRLSVLDFGGALGSSYFQCRSFLSGFNELSWSVVDQAAQVACGRKHFENQQLKFYDTVSDCLRGQHPNVLLLSSVLQYLRSPYEALADLLEAAIPFVIVERTAFNISDRDRLTVQHVPERIYGASYPAWFLSESTLRAVFETRYDLICEYPASDAYKLKGGEACFKGFQYQLKS
jgi:putative methyltransferase (TIGR04325 family)